MQSVLVQIPWKYRLKVIVTSQIKFVLKMLTNGHDIPRISMTAECKSNDSFWISRSKDQLWLLNNTYKNGWLLFHLLGILLYYRWYISMILILKNTIVL